MLLYIWTKERKSIKVRGFLSCFCVHPVHYKTTKYYANLRHLSLSIDIDVLDPAFAPGTGTPEIAGMTSREMVNVIRGLSGMNLISADVVEVSPAYDH